MTNLVKVKIKNFSYEPSVLEIFTGDEVVWENGDNMAHSATRSEAPSFDTGMIPPGASSVPIGFSVVTAPTGEGYFCRPHPFMTGTIVVRERPVKPDTVPPAD